MIVEFKTKSGLWWLGRAAGGCDDSWAFKKGHSHFRRFVDNKLLFLTMHSWWISKGVRKRKRVYNCGVI